MKIQSQEVLLNDLVYGMLCPCCEPDRRSCRTWISHALPTRSSVSLLLIVALAGCLPRYADRADDSVIVSPYVSTAPVIDADLSDWDTSKFISVTPANGVFDLELGPDAHMDDAENLSFRFGVANDDEYLYVACIVHVKSTRSPSAILTC